jgi:hypothetical protein
MILVLSLAALAQFGVFYYRAVLASVASQPLTGHILQMEGFPTRPLQAQDFPALYTLQEMCPQVGPEARSLKVARMYFRTLAIVKDAINGAFPGLSDWADREQTLCAQFAAVLLDQRLARTAEATAEMRSY